MERPSSAPRTRHANTNAWKFTIAIEVAGSFVTVPNELLSSDAARAARTRLAEFITQNYGNTPPTLISTAARLLKGIKSFNLEAFGFGVRLERENNEQPLTPLVIDS